MRAEIVRLGNSIEGLSDRQWELREAEERTKSLLEAQGDLIVRRAADCGTPCPLPCRWP